MARVLVLNGPNLGRLGSREPEVYGDQDLSALRVLLAEQAGSEVEIDLRQTDDEAELIHWLHEAVDAATPVILNPAAFTHYSYALRDAAALTDDLAEVFGVHFQLDDRTARTFDDLDDHVVGLRDEAFSEKSQ